LRFDCDNDRIEAFFGNFRTIPDEANPFRRGFKHRIDNGKFFATRHPVFEQGSAHLSAANE
jgi:hypothetical protein